MTEFEFATVTKGLDAGFLPHARAAYGIGQAAAELCERDGREVADTYLAFAERIGRAAEAHFEGIGDMFDGDPRKIAPSVGPSVDHREGLLRAMEEAASTVIAAFEYAYRTQGTYDERRALLDHLPSLIAVGNGEILHERRELEEGLVAEADRRADEVLATATTIEDLVEASKQF